MKVKRDGSYPGFHVIHIPGGTFDWVDYRCDVCKKAMTSRESYKAIIFEDKEPSDYSPTNMKRQRYVCSRKCANVVILANV